MSKRTESATHGTALAHVETQVTYAVQHRFQIFDWIRALTTSEFSLPYYPIASLEFDNKYPSQLNLGPFNYKTLCCARLTAKSHRYVCVFQLFIFIYVAINEM